MKLQNTSEPHARGAILVAAIFDAFLTVYKHRIEDLLRIATGGSGILQEGALHPDLVNRLSQEAAQTAQHILSMCIRALDYCPPVDITFGEYLRALVTADFDMTPNDPFGFRIAMVESFRRHGIYPSNVRNLSEESLLWHPPADEGALDKFFSKADRWSEIKYKESFLHKYSGDRETAYKIESALRQDFQKYILSDKTAFTKALRLVLEKPENDLGSLVMSNGQPFLDVNSVRPAYRIGEAGRTVADLVVEVSQQRYGYLDRERQKRVDKGELKPHNPDFTFRGGATMLIDLESAKVRYVVYKRIESSNRLETIRRFLTEEAPDLSLRATYFGDSRLNFYQQGRALVEPFALLHRSDPEEEV